MFSLLCTVKNNTAPRQAKSMVNNNLLKLSFLVLVALSFLNAFAFAESGSFTLSDGNVPYNIPDNGFALSSWDRGSHAPSGAYITKVEYSFKIDDRGDPGSFYCRDYVVDITSEDHGGNDSFVPYSRLGGRTDEGYDDDSADDSDIYVSSRTTHHFDGEDPDHMFAIWFKDQAGSDVGRVTNASLKIYWQRDP